MADSDYDRRDDRDDRRRDDRYDDRRPSRRDDDRPRKKGGGLMIVLVIFGVLGLVCAGGCGGMIWWMTDLANKMTGTAETFLAKVGAGDYSGAYNSMTPSYKSRKTLAEFTADMKAAKLDTYQAKSFTPTTSNSVGTRHSLGGTAQTAGGPVSITVVIEQGAGGNAFDFTVDDVTGPGIGGGTTTPRTAMSTPPTGMPTPPTGK